MTKKLDPRDATSGPVAVTAGDVYRVGRPGKPARHVRIVRVTNPRNYAPLASYVEITRTGNAKRGEPIRHQLTWRDGAWRMAVAFELTTL